ncbi:MAG TPA: transposase [Kofleriaceae bacterium]
MKPTEVASKATRRRFTTAEKIRVLREADIAARETGGVSALLRREGLYSSHLTSWRRQRDAGQFGKTPKKRGPVATPIDPRDTKIAELERSLRRAEAQRDRFERLCALQKKVSELFGIPLETEDETKP